MTLYLGAPVWASKAWVGNFFPPRSKSRDFLSLYSRRLNTVEGNTTFYALPSAETLDRWVLDTPPGFRFCLKFPKAISHEHRLQDAQVETNAFLDCLTRLGERAGPSFLQLPPTFNLKSIPSLVAYLDSLPKEFRYAVEVRHPDFYADPGEAALDDVLRQRDIARIVFDTRGLRRADPSMTDPATRKALQQKPTAPVRFTRTASFAFIRFVGQPPVEANTDLLAEWAGHAAGWLDAGDDVFFFCHMPDDRDVPPLCRAFYERVSARHPLPPMPTGEEIEQGRLL
jgi:uncharacterized protein YecE (DUF72 family)